MNLLMYFLFTITFLSFTYPVINGFCFGVVCSVAPMMSKYCCKLKRYCCQEYQAWLAPIIGTNDFLQDYIEAVAHEVINDQRDPFWRIFSRKVDFEDAPQTAQPPVSPSPQQPLPQSPQEYSQPLRRQFLFL